MKVSSLLKLKSDLHVFFNKQMASSGVQKKQFLTLANDATLPPVSVRTPRVNSTITNHGASVIHKVHCV